MSKMIQSALELRELFFNYSKSNRSNKLLSTGVYVDGKTRKSVMISTEQAKITLCGCVYDIEFENLGGGVYRAFVKTKSV